ncbi:MAG: GH3 family acyl-acid amido synthetase [Gemmataceae bacterium]
MNGNGVQGWIWDSSLVRRAAEVVLGAAGRRHLARLDRLAPARCQRNILLGLLHQAQGTRFGRDHDFRRIRTVADFRRLVPLCTRAELWRDYWQPVYPHLAGATWPAEEDGARSVSEGHTSLTLRTLSFCHQAALRTALALVAHARPRARLLSGAWLLVSDVGPSSRMENAILAQRLPTLLRPYTVLSTAIESERLAHLPLTGLIGPAERLLSLLANVKQMRGKASVRDIWPRLSVILYTRRPSAGPVVAFRAEVGDDVLLMEMAGRAEGPIAVEDSRFGAQRLLFDHGVYFEFVPPAQAGEPRCPRYGIEEIELDVPYELAITSPAGLWACRIGRTVCLERRDPPLLRFVETAIRPPTPAEVRRPARRTDLIPPTQPLPQPHLQSGGSPAAPPETTYHSPWSILADRG